MPSEIEKLLHGSPHVDCPRCSVEMTIRSVKSAGDTGFKTGLYVCPKCGTETEREYKPELVSMDVSKKRKLSLPVGIGIGLVLVGAVMIIISLL